MSASELKVLLPGGRTLSVPRVVAAEKHSLAETLVDAGVHLNTRCGRQGKCAGCTVDLVCGSFRFDADRNAIAAPARIKSCLGRLAPGVGAVVSVPVRSLIETQAQIGTSFRVHAPPRHQPAAACIADREDHGLAIDIGTTTVVVALVDLHTGGITSQAAALNRQVEFGDNVVTRIQLASDPVQRERLQEAIVQRTLAPLIRTACDQACIAPGRIIAVTVAGNTTMLHLLVGADPTPMGTAPFLPQFIGQQAVPAVELGLEMLSRSAMVHLLPGFSAFVGADIAAGCVCCGLAGDPRPALLLDIGTNGEILLQAGGRLFGTATAAGPAFEGGRLECGTRAAPGAISHVKMTSHRCSPLIETIPGSTETTGLAGSAYLDLLAQGRECGLIDERGRFTTRWDELPAGHRWERPPLRGLMLRADDEMSVVTEADIAQLQQAKAAIAAGIITLLQRASLAPSDIHRVFLAGGFGQYLDPESAIRSGLLPGFTTEQIETVGNAALGGAWLALNDTGVLAEMAEIIGRTDILELNTDPRFEDTYIDQLAIP